MKKTTSSLLTTALILFCAGLLLCLSAALYVKIKGIEVFDVKKSAGTIETISVELDEILSNSPDSNYMNKLSKSPFSRIDILSFAGDVKICENAEKTELILKDANTGNIHYEIKGDTLQIREVEPVGFLGLFIDQGGFSFKGLRHIFSSGNRYNSGRTIQLNLERGLVLDQIEINSGYGDVYCEKLSAENVVIKASVCDICLRDAQNPESKFNIQGKVSDIELDNNLYASCALSAKIGNMSVKLAEMEGQSTILDLWCGSASVTTKLPTTYYKLNLSSTLGSVSRNGKSEGKKLNEPGNTASRISSSVLFGNASVSFEGENEENYVPKTVFDPPQPETDESVPDLTEMVPVL